MTMKLAAVVAGALVLTGCASQHSFTPISRSVSGGLKWDIDRTNDGGVMVSSRGRYQPRGMAAFNSRAASTGCLNGNRPGLRAVRRGSHPRIGVYVIALYNCG